MTTYKIQISKRSVVELEDSSAWIGARETFADSTAEIRAQQDVDVAVYLDDALKHTVTLTDAGATLEFTADIAEGEHTIRVVPAKSPIHQTDVCVDKILIDDQVMVLTQWDFNNQILGTASTLKQQLADPQHQTHQYVWWGTMVTNDSSYDLAGHFYRPKIVSDHQGEWHWTFTKTSAGKLWTSAPGDTDDLLYDSTAQHTYYACTPQQEFMTDIAAWTTWVGKIYNDSTERADSAVITYQGPGTYDSTLTLVNDSLDQSVDPQNQVVILSYAEFSQLQFNQYYHNTYSHTAITVT